MTADEVTPERERRLDAIVWPRLEKRFRECAPEEIADVIAALNREAAQDRQRALVAELRIAAHEACIDQYRAAVADGTARLERWANGSRSSERRENR